MLLLAARGPTARARSKPNGRSCPAATHARVPGSKSQPACSLYALGSLALQMSQPFCALLLGFIGLALSRPGYYLLRRVHWHPASPSAYLARFYGLNLSRPIFSASGTQCKPLHRPDRLQVGSSAHSRAGPLARPFHQRMLCTANYISPSMGSQQVQPYPAGSCRRPLG
jgi:hypothetical protein